MSSIKELSILESRVIGLLKYPCFFEDEIPVVIIGIGMSFCLLVPIRNTLLDTRMLGKKSPEDILRKLVSKRYFEIIEKFCSEIPLNDLPVFLPKKRDITLQPMLLDFAHPVTLHVSEGPITGEYILTGKAIALFEDRFQFSFFIPELN